MLFITNFTAYNDIAYLYPAHVRLILLQFRKLYDRSSLQNLNLYIMTILIATDYSLIAENAVEYAAAVAQQFKIKLVLFNSFTLPKHVANTILPASSISKLIAENEDRLKNRAELLASTYDIEVVHESAFTFLEDEWNNLIKKYNAGMVVLGMADKAWDQDLLGNTTTSAIKKMRFPVLAIPLGAKFNGLNRVLFACDVLHDIPTEILSRLKKQIPDLKAEVEVFFVDKKIDKLKTEGIGVVTPDSVTDEQDGLIYSYKNVKSNTVIKEIEKEIIAFKADLLIMTPKKYGFWASLVHKSKTRMMASGLNVPLLSIPL